MINSGLEDLSERLLIRSQEAILQLDLWIQRQQQWDGTNDASNCEDTLEKLTDQYNLYMSQLNSLYVRSEHIRDKLNHNRLRANKNKADHKNIEDLVYEFQDLTLKLNELAVSRKRNISPKKLSTRSSSIESFNLRPLKLIEKQKMRNNLNKTVTFEFSKNQLKFCNSHNENNENNENNVVSLPGSPIKQKRNGIDNDNEFIVKKFLRHTKSYDTGLNSSKKNSKSKKSNNDDTYNSIFKNNQRLSISFFEDYENSNATDSATHVDSSLNDSGNISDQATVISSSSLIEEEEFKAEYVNNTYLPLRKYNSHESILSTRFESTNNHNKTYGSAFKTFNITPFLACSTTSSITINATATTATTASNRPSIFNSPGLTKIYNNNSFPDRKNSSRTTSKDLLSIYTNTQEIPSFLQNQRQNKTTSSSFFDNWGFFGLVSPSSSSMLSSEIGKKTKNSAPAKKLCTATKRTNNVPGTIDNCTTLTMGPNGSRFFSTMNDPVFDNTVSVDELHTALNTELRLEF